MVWKLVRIYLVISVFFVYLVYKNNVMITIGFSTRKDNQQFINYLKDSIKNKKY